MPVIGWREWISFPDLGIPWIKAKVDSGARSSSIHAFNVREYEKDGNPWASFEVHPLQRVDDESIEVHSEILEYRSVKSSSGEVALRPVIVTNVTLLDVTWPIELTLASRDDMGFRMLLGREAFRGRFLVDGGKSYYGGKPIRKKKKKAEK